MEQKALQDQKMDKACPEDGTLKTPQGSLRAEIHGRSSGAAELWKSGGNGGIPMLQALPASPWHAKPWEHGGDGRIAMQQTLLAAPWHAEPQERGGNSGITALWTLPVAPQHTKL